MLGLIPYRTFAYDDSFKWDRCADRQAEADNHVLHVPVVMNSVIEFVKNSSQG